MTDRESIGPSLSVLHCLPLWYTARRQLYMFQRNRYIFSHTQCTWHRSPSTSYLIQFMWFLRLICAMAEAAITIITDTTAQIGGMFTPTAPIITATKVAMPIASSYCNESGVHATSRSTSYAQRRMRWLREHQSPRAVPSLRGSAPPNHTDSP